MKFEKLSDDMKSAEVEFHIQNCAEIFSRMSVRIPKNLQYVAQAIHLELCESMCHTSSASNEFDAIEKYRHLSIVKDTIRKIYKRINYLVLTKSITIGQGNEFVMEWLGERPQRNRLLISLEKEDMKYKVVFSNGTEKIVDHPNFIKMNPRYPSFICCGRDDAECVMLQEGEESICYNIAVKRYPEYDVVDVRAV